MMGFDLILIVGVIAYALGWRPQFNQTKSSQTSQAPLELLKARYARGEISREQYDQMRRDLESWADSTGPPGSPLRQVDERAGTAWWKRGDGAAHNCAILYQMN